MKLSTFAIKAWRIFSMIAVFGISVYSYSLFATDVGVHFNSAGQADEFMTKSDIFYILAGLIVVNNVLLPALGKQLLKIPTNLLPIPHQEIWEDQRDNLEEHIQNWIYALVAMINTSIAMTVFALATVNNEFKYKIGDLEGLFYIVVVSLLFIIIALPIRLFIKPRQA